MTDPRPSRSGALVLGYGSVGSTHARLLASMGMSLTIVDTKGEARARARREHPGAVIAETLESLEDALLARDVALAVIATWGPSHRVLFDALVDRGVRRILCEKPLATSIAAADAMVARAARDGVALASNHYLRYSGFVTAFRGLVHGLRLGDPVAIVAAGGASCLVTVGIHWVDLAIQLFGTAPVRVVSSALGEAINPRSADLAHYGGTSVWSFGDGRELTLSFNNRSSVYPRLDVYFRDAVASVVDSSHEVTVRRRDLAAVARFPAITRTGPAADVIFQRRLDGVLDWDDALMLGLRELSAGKADLCPAGAGAVAVNASIGALIAAREGRAVALPIRADSPWGQEQWPIT
jgi:predicted dehydrogenase